MSEASLHAPKGHPGDRLLGTHTLHLFGCWNLFVAQPLLDLLGSNPAFFVSHRVSRLDLLSFLAFLCLALPASLALLVAAVWRLSPRHARTLSLALLAILVFAGSLHVLANQLSAPDLVLLSIAAAITVIFGAAMRRPTFRSFVSVLSVLSLAVPLVFLGLSEARSLLMKASPTISVPVPKASDSQPPVVVLLFDELPLSSLLNDLNEVDDSRFPHFARLAQQSTWYSQASSVAAATEEAVPAILTGLYPVPGAVPTATSYPRNLFTLLQSTHHLNVAESLTQLCPVTLCREQSSASGRWRSLLEDTLYVYLHLLLPPALASRLPEIGATWRDFSSLDQRPSAPPVPAGTPSDEAIEADVRTLDVARDFDGFLQRIRDAPRRSLHYLHLQLPHIPWRYLPSGAEYGPIGSNFAPGVLADTRWTDDPWLLTQALKRHLLQVGYADTLLGRLMDTLEELDLWNDALLVVLADHGMAFLPGQPGRRLTTENAQDVLAIPLFVKLPGQLGPEIDPRNVETVDLLPTLGELLGWHPLPWSTQGASFAAPGGSRRTTKRWFESEHSAHEIDFEEWTGGANGARLQHSLVGTGDLASLYNLGPRPNLLGMDVAETDANPEPTVEVAFDQPWLWDDVDLESRFRPTYVTGYLRYLDGSRPSAGADERMELAVAVNGRIVATTRSYPAAAERFASLFPEEALIEGRNPVEVLLLNGDQLRRVLNRSSVRYSLETRGTDSWVIAASNGSSCTAEPSAVLGRVERLGNAFFGFAFDPSVRQRRVILMVFVDNKHIHSGFTGQAPPADWPEAREPELEHSGFRFRLSPSQLSSGSQVLIFGISGKHCAALPIDPS